MSGPSRDLPSDSLDAAPDAIIGQPAVDAAPARVWETILIVEDNEAMQEVTRRMLTRNGYRVLCAPGARDACSIAIEHRGDIHLLLTDIIMPRMQGRELATRIRAARPTIRVLYMSGYAHSILTSQGKLHPDDFLLEKPFTEPILLDRVRQVLGSPA